ncbi:MAG TPA: hypothetical protein VM223_14235 [Planctomycetota bacterium]|nr:hypothetical protein [Planctomycetota bacterium]
MSRGWSGVSGDQLQGELKARPAIHIRNPAEAGQIQDSQSLRRKRAFIDRRAHEPE